MGPRLALIRVALIAALVLSATAPNAALAANPEEGLHAGRLTRSRVIEMVFGVPINADGIAGPPLSTPTGDDDAFTGDDDSDGASETEGTDDGTDDANGTTESTTTSSNNDYGESGDGNTDYGNADPSNGGLTSNTKSTVGTQTLLDIIIGIIFGQDRPWDDKKGRRQ